MTRFLLPFYALVLAAQFGGCSRQEHLDGQVPPARHDDPDVDWKEKYFKEVDYHDQTQQVKNSEIAALNVELENRASRLKIAQEKTAVLETELAGRSARLCDAQRQLDIANQLLVKYEADQKAMVGLLEKQLGKLAETESKFMELAEEKKRLEEEVEKLKKQKDPR